MKAKLLFILFNFCTGVLQAENLLEDFEFKTELRIKKNGKTYPDLKPVYEDNRLTLVTKYKTSAAGFETRDRQRIAAGRDL